MNISKPYFNADKAWVRLSERLQAEGLVRDKPTSIASRTYIPYLKLAASFIVIVATAAMLFFFSGKDQSQVFIVANKVIGQTLVKTLDDGSVVYLASNSSISFTDEYNRSNRSLKLEGEAFFEVVSNSELPFIVEMEGALVKVIGTSFVLKNVPGYHVELFVETGKVGFLPSKDSQKSIVVEKGQRLIFDGNHFYVSFLGHDHKWRNNHLHFRNERLENIFAVINKNFGVNVKIEDRSLAKRHLTVTFHNNTVDEMVSIIREYYNLDSKTIDDGTIVLTKKQ